MAYSPPPRLTANPLDLNGDTERAPLSPDPNDRPAEARAASMVVVGSHRIWGQIIIQQRPPKQAWAQVQRVRKAVG